jgi:hypothetical protein
MQPTDEVVNQVAVGECKIEQNDYNDAALSCCTVLHTHGNLTTVYQNYEDSTAANQIHASKYALKVEMQVLPILLRLLYKYTLDDLLEVTTTRSFVAYVCTPCTAVPMEP